jgi:hypothetical protein
MVLVEERRINAELRCFYMWRRAKDAVIKGHFNVFSRIGQRLKHVYFPRDFFFSKKCSHPVFIQASKR